MLLLLMLLLHVCFSALPNNIFTTNSTITTTAPPLPITIHKRHTTLLLPAFFTA